jgi:hypothetical protein
MPSNDGMFEIVEGCATEYRIGPCLSSARIPLKAVVARPDFVDAGRLAAPPSLNFPSIDGFWCARGPAASWMPSNDGMFDRWSAGTSERELSVIRRVLVCPRVGSVEDAVD